MTIAWRNIILQQSHLLKKNVFLILQALLSCLGAEQWLFWFATLKCFETYWSAEVHASHTGIWVTLDLVFPSDNTANWKPISQLCALPDLQTVSNRARITDTEIWAKLDPRHYWKVEAHLTIILCSTTPGILQTVRNRAHVIDTEIWAKLHWTPARRDKGDIVV